MHLHSGYWGLLRFSKTSKLWSLKATFPHALFAAINHIRITSNEPWNTDTQNELKSTSHKSQTMTFLTYYSKTFCFLRGPLRWLTAVKNAYVSWLLNFNIHVFEKHSKGLTFGSGFEKRWSNHLGWLVFLLGK